MPKKDKVEWLDSDGNLNPDIFVESDIDWSQVQPTCTLPPKTPAEKDHMLKNNIHWFVDHWIIVRPDGTRLLNGNEEEFEAALKEFVDDYRSDW